MSTLLFAFGFPGGKESLELGLRQSSAAIQFPLGDRLDGGSQPVRRQGIGAVHAREDRGNLRDVGLAKLFHGSDRCCVAGAMGADRANRLDQRRHIDCGVGRAGDEDRHDGYVSGTARNAHA